jgi:ADP-ribose pyrophosphatase
MDNSRYEVFKQRLVCENNYFSVFLDTIGKNGKILFEHYISITSKTHNKEQITGVMTLPIKNGQYGLLKIYRHPIRNFSWELPGGFMEPNETPISSAQRELEEEAGLICEEKHISHIGNFYASPGLSSGKVCIFLAEKCKPAMQIEKPELGISQFKWFSEEEIEEFIMKGLIHDISTILAIYRSKKLFDTAP